VRRVAVVLVVSLALVACGSSKKTVSTSTGTSTVVNPAVEKAEIKSAYVKFFSSKTDVAGKVKLLQNGPQFKPVIQIFASNPLASNVSAAVSSVTLQGANKAKVVYVVKFGGSSLPKQTGTAVRENGTWKVGNASLCKLIALGGTTPSACKS
jgi:uncharacterized protein YcfL